MHGITYYIQHLQHGFPGVDVAKIIKLTVASTIPLTYGVTSLLRWKYDERKMKDTGMIDDQPIKSIGSAENKVQVIDIMTRKYYMRQSPYASLGFFSTPYYSHTHINQGDRSQYTKIFDGKKCIENYNIIDSYECLEEQKDNERYDQLLHASTTTYHSGFDNQIKKYIDKFSLPVNNIKLIYPIVVHHYTPRHQMFYHFDKNSERGYASIDKDKLIEKIALVRRYPYPYVSLTIGLCIHIYLILYVKDYDFIRVFSWPF